MSAPQRRMIQIINGKTRSLFRPLLKLDLCYGKGGEESSGTREEAKVNLLALHIWTINFTLARYSQALIAESIVQPWFGNDW